MFQDPDPDRPDVDFLSFLVNYNKTPDSSCLVCANLIDSDSEKTKQNLFGDLTSQNLLSLFSSLFQISPRIYVDNGTDLMHLSNPLCCSLCITTISECVNILRQMKSLQLGLNKLTTKLQNNLVRSYHGLSVTNAVEEDPFSPENMSKSIIRKSFVQCLSKRQANPIESTSSQTTRVKIPSDSTSSKGSVTKYKPRKVYKQKVQDKESNDPLKLICGRGKENAIIVSPLEPNLVETVIKMRSNSPKRAKFSKVPLVSVPLSANTLKDRIKLSKASKHMETATVTSISDYLNEPTLSLPTPENDANNKQEQYFDTDMEVSNLKFHDERGRLFSTVATSKKKMIDWSVKFTEIYECPYCKTKYLEKDYMTEAGKLAIKCDLPDCSRKFSHFQTFSRHHESTCYKRPPPGKFQCNYCGKQCFNARTLKDHEISIHTKNFEFFCDVCGLGYVSKASLRSHFNFCHKEKDLKCHLCPQTYRSKTMLNVHLRRHKGELPYMCTICGKQMVSYNKLKRHESIHNEVPKFPCKICNKRFKSRDYVRNHIWSFHNKKISSKPLRVIEREPISVISRKQNGKSTSASPSLIPVLCESK